MITQQIDRPELRFAETVAERFGFLSEYGFERVQSDGTFVRFESKRLYVNVYHGRQSYELSLEMGPLKAGHDHSVETAYSISEIMGLYDPEEAKKYRNYATHTAEGVAEGVERLARLFGRYVDAGVLDRLDLFVRLQAQRETWTRDFARDLDLYQARRKLDVAWHARDYGKVVELLEPIRAELTPSELLKLEYAKKQME